MITTDVENYPGFANAITGPDLMNQMKEQAQRVGTEIITDVVESVNLSKIPFEVKATSSTVLAQTVIVATGAEAKWLGIESEKKYQGRGVSACATCDGFFFKEKVVAVVGGGDTAAEEATYLTNHASKVYLLHRRDELRASDIMAKRVLSNNKIEPKWFRVVDEILGNDMGVNSVRIKDPRNGETEVLAIDGIFMAIGHRPNTAFLEGQLETDRNGYIVCTPGTSKTNVKGVFAAGDVRDAYYRQAVTAAGTGCMAAIEASRYLETL